MSFTNYDSLYSTGVLCVICLKRRHSTVCDAKPHRFAISCTFRFVVFSMTFISSKRYSSMMSFGDLPTAVCVADERYLVEMFSCSA